jgi:protein-S-isoprenylcysteine O-methyltransferase Ste14
LDAKPNLELDHLIDWVFRREMQQKSIEVVGYIVDGLTVIVYCVLLFVLEVPPDLNVLQYAGWILLVAGTALVILTIAALLRKRTVMIDNGIFSVVRHPMYLGSMCIFLALSFFLPHWIMAILSAVAIVYIYWFTVVEEKRNIERFGDNYRRYMQSVPRINLLAGIIRLQRSMRREK